VKKGTDANDQSLNPGRGDGGDVGESGGCAGATGGGGRTKGTLAVTSRT